MESVAEGVFDTDPWYLRPLSSRIVHGTIAIEDEHVHCQWIQWEAIIHSMVRHSPYHTPQCPHKDHHVDHQHPPSGGPCPLGPCKEEGTPMATTAWSHTRQNDTPERPSVPIQNWSQAGECSYHAYHPRKGPPWPLLPTPARTIRQENVSKSSTKHRTLIKSYSVHIGSFLQEIVVRSNA